MKMVGFSRNSALVALALTAMVHCAISIALFPDFAAQRIGAPHDALAANVYWVLNLPLAWTAAFWMVVTHAFGDFLGVDLHTNLAWVPPLVMSLIQMGGVYLIAQALLRGRRAKQFGVKVAAE
jgi:hypothetical protein